MSFDSESWKRAAREYAQNRPTLPYPSNLPDSWEAMSVGKLWEILNNPERNRDAPQSTYDAVVWSLIYNDGWYDKAVRNRIGQLSQAQRKELIAALMRKRINPFIVAAIKKTVRP